jgi:hypothetical protein
MKRQMIAALAVVLCLPLAGMAVAGPIERACMNSDRKAANRQVCNCIQQAADMTLRSTDQRRAAKFFSDPDEAQKVRLSDRPSDDAFWDRYKSFGEAAESFCAG